VLKNHTILWWIVYYFFNVQEDYMKQTLSLMFAVAILTSAVMSSAVEAREVEKRGKVAETVHQHRHGGK
jgi:hypothetical protein